MAEPDVLADTQTVPGELTARPGRGAWPRSRERDVRARVEELKLLRPGWLDGKGLAPPPAALDWVAVAFEERYPDDLRLPYLFLTPAGRVLAEWSLAPWSLSLEVDPVTKRGGWHALNLDTDREVEKELDLASGDAWAWLAEQVRSMGGVAE